MFASDAHWAAAAQRIGFSLHHAVGAYGEGAHFARLERAVGPAIAPSDPAGWAASASTTTWMVGRAGAAGGSAEALVLVDIVSSGSTSTTHTHAIVRVDPPLFLGLGIKASSWLARMLQPADIVTGDPWIDERHRVTAFDPRGAVELLRPIGEGGVGVALQATDGFGLAVSDASVDVFADELVTEPERLRAMLDAAAAAALAIGERRPFVPRSPWLAGVMATFETVAGEAGESRFRFDGERVMIHGEAAGARVRLALECEPRVARTTLHVAFPRAFGVALRLTRKGSLSFLRGVFGLQDIAVGDRELDDTFVVQGASSERVREALASAPLRRALVDLARGADVVAVGDAAMTFAWPGVLDAFRLRAVLAAARVAGVELAPRAPRQGPFR